MSIKDNLNKQKFFDLSKQSSIWLGIITLVVMISQKVFTSSLDNNTVLLIIVLVVVSLVFQGYLINSAVQKDFFNKINDLEAFIKDNGMDKIVSEKSAAIIEKNAKEIWIFTKDLKNDLPDSDHDNGKFVVQSVENNLERGKRYTYFVPDTLRGKINDYRNKYKSFIKEEEQVKFVLIEHEYFLFPSEIAFYDPYETNKGIAQVIQFFPDDKVNYYIGYADNYQTDFFGKVSSLLENKRITKVEYF